MFSSDDTIVALATPRGRGGLGVVRLSGVQAQEVAQALLGRATALEARRATVTTLMDGVGGRRRAIDEVVATLFPSPGSYTGEDVVEVSAHGSPVLLDRIVALAVAAGARLAEPGEFTFRAFLHGRLDLVQAEAVADLIEAVTPRQARVAFDQLEGTMTARIAALDEQLFDLMMRLEASLDFPEEGYHFITPAEVAEGIAVVRGKIEETLAEASQGRLVREGCQVVILGTPNVGKSSIFNALLGSSRSIVAGQPGTTRDLVTERLDVDGLAVTLVDSAGLRPATDLVEEEGVARARGAVGVASVALVVLDRSRAWSEAELQALREDDEVPRVVAVNKVDLPAAWQPREFEGLDGLVVVEVSAATGEGLVRLRSALLQELGGGEPLRDSPAVANRRHAGLLEQAAAALGAAERSVAQGAAEEFVLADMARARTTFEELTGSRTPDQVLEQIFERFCIGK